jgi:hypothetical protein
MVADRLLDQPTSEPSLHVQGRSFERDHGYQSRIVRLLIGIIAAWKCGPRGRAAGRSTPWHPRLQEALSYPSPAALLAERGQEWPSADPVPPRAAIP